MKLYRKLGIGIDIWTGGDIRNVNKDTFVLQKNVHEKGPSSLAVRLWADDELTDVETPDS